MNFNQVNNNAGDVNNRLPPVYRALQQADPNAPPSDDVLKAAARELFQRLPMTRASDDDYDNAAALLRAVYEMGLTHAARPADCATGGVLQPWVVRLGLRHQGVIVSAVRGCDSVGKEDPAKALTRAYRAAVLTPHCGDVRKSSSFIQYVTGGELLERMEAVAGSFDHYPIHYVLHLTHAAEILGYKAPRESPVNGAEWRWFYARMCHKLHMTPESEAGLDARLNADEVTFAKQGK